MKTYLNRFMSALGYVPRSSTSIGSLTFDVDSASVDDAIAKLAQLEAGAIAAEAAINSTAALADFGVGDIAAEPARDELLCEVRALIQEIREERRNCIRTARCWGAEAAPVTAEIVADETPGLILDESRKQTTLLEVLAKQGEENRRDLGETTAPTVATMSSAEISARSMDSWRSAVSYPGLPG